jgi:hypothetical protein
MKAVPKIELCAGNKLPLKCPSRFEKIGNDLRPVTRRRTASEAAQQIIKKESELGESAKFYIGNVAFSEQGLGLAIHWEIFNQLPKHLKSKKTIYIKFASNGMSSTALHWGFGSLF